MLYSIDKGCYVYKIPHKEDFNIWRSRISDEDYSKVFEALDEKANSSEVNTAGWIPGNDWTGTVYEPIYHACGENRDASGKFFGLIVFDYFMRRDDVWGFGKFEKNDVEIGSTTYYRLKNPPERK